jgi:hypothetical protein
MKTDLNADALCKALKASQSSLDETFAALVLECLL